MSELINVIILLPKTFQNSFNDDNTLNPYLLYTIAYNIDLEPLK